MDSLKQRQLNFLASEIKLEEKSTARRSIADVALLKAVTESGSNAYLRAVDPTHKSVGRNVPKTRLNFDSFNLLKDNAEQTWTLDAILLRLDVALDTPHRDDLNAYLRANEQISFLDGQFKFKVGRRRCDRPTMGAGGAALGRRLTRAAAPRSRRTRG